MKKTLRIMTTLRGVEESEIYLFLKGNGFTDKMIKALHEKGGLIYETETDERKTVTVVELEEEQ